MNAEATITYERGFRSLLWRFRPLRLQLGVDLLLRRAQRLADRGNAPAAALQTTYARSRGQVIRQLLHVRLGEPTAGESLSRRRRAQQTATLFEHAIPARPDPHCPDFHCDAALARIIHSQRNKEASVRV